MGSKMHRPNTKAIARARIDVLFERAREFFPEHPEWSDRCVGLARSISRRHRVRMPRRYRMQYCRHCGGYLVPGNTMRVRIHRGRVIVTCRKCGSQRRYPAVRPDDR